LWLKRVPPTADKAERERQQGAERQHRLYWRQEAVEYEDRVVDMLIAKGLSSDGLAHSNDPDRIGAPIAVSLI
jgi:hypothetical protein